MKIIIVGLGRVGETLAAELNNDADNDIVVVDEDAEKVKHVATKYDLMGVIGNGATRATQKEAGVDNSDLLIAVTGSDELNLLCCVMAKKAANCQTIARVKSPEYAIDTPYLKEELGLAMVINPEYAAAKEITRILNFPAAIKVDSFAKGRVDLIKFRMPEGSSLIGMSLRQAMTRLKCNVLVCVVERGDEAFIPKGDFVFGEKDIISIVAAPKSSAAFFAKISNDNQPIKHATVIGGGSITRYLCETLQRAGIGVKVIEKNREICEELATRYDYVSVICGDPADEDILREEGIDRAEAFVAMTEFDEENILLSLFAKNIGARKIITKINRIDYREVIDKLELDSIIYPKNITADMILGYVRATRNTRGSSMETLYNIIKGQIEAAEFRIGDNSPITGKPLSELQIKENVLIAAILRGRAMIVPGGSTVIESGDTIVVVSKHVTLSNASDIIKR